MYFNQKHVKIRKSKKTWVKTLHPVIVLEVYNCNYLYILYYYILNSSKR